MRKLTAIGLILAAVVFLAGSSDAQRPSFWPATTGEPVIQEWYADIPWHQKLGTYAGNEIDVPIILPYDALPKEDQQYCKDHGLEAPACMLELGINNVLGVYRTDTLYDPNATKIKDAAECSKNPDQPCIEVKLDLASFWTRSTASGIELKARPFGTEPQHQPDPPFTQDIPSYYGGYTITDGSTYAPQLPWYMSHYCDAFYPSTADTQDTVCYADYFSPMNNGFNPLPEKRLDEWPRSLPWSVSPAAQPPAPTNHCQSGLTQCTLAMAGFDLKPVPEDGKLPPPYDKYNGFLLEWFNFALQNFPTDRDNTRHFPWRSGKNQIDWAFIYPRAVLNPFLGTFDAKLDTNAPTCETTVSDPGNCTNTGNTRATHFVYPRRCSLGDLTQAAGGSQTAVDALRNCSLNYELHHNGYWVQWPRDYWRGIFDAGMIANQYGRTSFLFAGVPGMQFPVSFYKDTDEATKTTTLSVYERVYNATIFSLDLPVTNVADNKRAFSGRNYTDLEFYHTLLMSNHMESDPWQFAEGISGKALWHNEYRTQKMYQSRATIPAPDYIFAAAFDPGKAPSPFHNYTCDGCHVRNGSGVPINTERKLDPKLREFMKGDEYQPYNPKDYTFTGDIRPMKLVFFDLKRQANVTSRYSAPLAFPLTLINLLIGQAFRNPGPLDVLYNNKVMNFYGDSFHVNPDYNYAWNYEAAASNRMVVSHERRNKELDKKYEPLQAKLKNFRTSPDCQLEPPPAVVPWPKTCKDIDGDAILSAIEGADPTVGFMHLNGKRLGNSSAIEAIPNNAILGFHEAQKGELGEKIAGEIVWNAGSRDGVNGQVRPCTTKSATDCYIARFGWLGDRVSLEDQVANAAFVEMNLTTKEGYKKLYPDGNVKFPIRYAAPNCGPANKACVDSPGNSDLSERDVQRMADYARWVGNPTRSEFQVSQQEVIRGEQIFRQVKCDTCHVIRKIEIPDPDDTMLSKFFRDRLAKRTTKEGQPFLSYIGTDLLMHDMGYLSQVGNASQSIRDDDGVVKPEFSNYVQKIRTPPLKGLRFNRFVTDSHKNTQKEGDPACDFLLHDGRACDAIEAAFLHDGPAIKKLGMIDALNQLTGDMIRALRAFLYSL